MATLAAASAAAALAQPNSHWEEREAERNWKESAFEYPAAPKPADLVEFAVSALASFRFFVDAASIRVGQDGVVRYTLVARSANGVDNVSYEGIRCRGGLVKVYAGIRGDGTWNVRSSAAWQEIQPKSIQRWHQVLRREYFCPQDAIIADAAEGVDALKRGGHPRKANFYTRD